MGCARKDGCGCASAGVEVLWSGMSMSSEGIVCCTVLGLCMHLHRVTFGCRMRLRSPRLVLQLTMLSTAGCPIVRTCTAAAFSLSLSLAMFMQRQGLAPMRSSLFTKTRRGTS